MKKVISSHLVMSLILTAALLIVYLTLRAGFLVSNYGYFQNESASSIAMCFGAGMRFDLAALFIINIPVLFFYNLPFRFIDNKWYLRVVIFLFFLINLTAITINIADYGYFPTIERRLLYEPYTMLPDIIRMIPGLIGYHYALFIVFFSSVLLFIFIFRRIYGFMKAKVSFNSALPARVVSFAFLVLLSIVTIRGGLQYKPLRIANAFDSEKIDLGYLKLNSTYTVVRSYFQPKLPSFQFLNEDESSAIIQNLFKSGNESMLSNDFPFERIKNPVGEPRKLNVVIFIMESWSASFIGSISGGKTRTPFFDSLSNNGVLFTSFFANGQRSIEAVPCILASIPAIYSTSVIGSQSEVNRFRGLGTILSELGYTTSFHHGAATGSMGFDSFSKLAGFSKYYGRESIQPAIDSITDGSWGICDEPFFLETEKVLSGYNQPFCSAIFSLSSHDPYTIPDYRRPLFDKFSNEPDYEQAIRYSDFSLRQFFEVASKEKWFNNTVFIITADHTLFNSRSDFYSTFHAPLLIYSPGHIEPQRLNRTSSHADILPAILDILNIPSVHCSMGFSAIDNSREKYAFVKYASFYCIISDSFVLLNDLEHPPALYSLHSDPKLSKDISSSNPQITEDLDKKLKAYLQVSTNAIGNNRVFSEKSYP